MQRGNEEEGCFYTMKRGNEEEGCFYTMKRGNEEEGYFYTMKRGNEEEGCFDTLKRGNEEKGCFYTMKRGNEEEGCFDAMKRGNEEEGCFYTMKRGNEEEGCFDAMKRGNEEEGCFYTLKRGNEEEGCFSTLKRGNEEEGYLKKGSQIRVQKKVPVKDRSENYRTASPPNIRLCIHCLQAVFALKPPPKIEARTHLQLGSILYSHTKNVDDAKKHLLASGQSSEAKPLLLQAIEVSKQSPFWHCRLLFQLAQIHASELDFQAACQLLGGGADFAAAAGSQYTTLLFLLSKGMLLLISKDAVQVNETLSRAGSMIETWTGHAVQKESLKVFFLVLQVCHYLAAGQVKSVKPALKQLQQSIQTITQLHSDEDHVGPKEVDMFQWLPKEHMCVLVYLAGYMDKAQKYTDKALMQIEKLKMLDAHPLLSAFQIMLLEHIVMCRLIMGNKTTAIQEIFQACHVCQAQPRLFTTHGSQIHTLLGLYAMSMNCMEAADAQFHTALKLSESSDLSLFINMNLAIVYLRMGKQQGFMALLDRIDPDKMEQTKRYLRETLKMANAEDLNRLTSCSLVLLGHIFLSLGNSRESQNMVTPAMQLAGKIPDVHVQLWASSLLKDLYRLSGDMAQEEEECRQHTSFSKSLLEDHFQSSQLSEHGLIQWTEGACPFHLNTSGGLI
ncbi:SCC4-like protein [Mya arenaria]|uniref:MAU2 chromatid cohesion factor homolog n=1 Tax=Mya arenaria TaxID=6604 RepID=A0ABY7DRP9_MYAAR|nr:SCC4-like protein [Mya arenaria]